MMNTDQRQTHPFELAGLGVAPFRYVRYQLRKRSEGLSACDACSTGIRHEYYVTGSGEGDKPFKVGCDCIAKLDPGLWVEVKAARRAEVDAGRRDSAAETRKRVSAAAVAAVFAKWPELEGCDDPIVADIVEKIRRFGSVSERAIDFAVTRACRASGAWQGPLPPPPCNVPALSGRVDLVGRVVHTKAQEGAYGVQFKMLLAVRSDAGEWKAWSTIPSGLFDMLSAECVIGGRGEGEAQFDVRRLRGRVVRITAAIDKVSDRDPGFAFLSRPAVTKAKAPKARSRKAASCAA